MKLFRYWASAEKAAQDIKGRPVVLKRWSGSNESVEVAKAEAERLLEKLIAEVALLDLRKPKNKNRSEYSYGVNGVPEEIIGDMTETYGVSRNRFGCLVLNVSEAMFVDVDLPRYSFLAKLFKKPRPEDTFLATLESWVGWHAGFGVRVYRTAGGLRYLFTHASFTVSDQTLSWMGELGADPVYARLCKVQSCFRARLSPKPWRINMNAVPSNYPREDAKAQESFRKWLADYDQKSQNFATCKFLKTVGLNRVCDELSLTVREHDRATKALSDLPLA